MQFASALSLMDVHNHVIGELILSPWLSSLVWTNLFSSIEMDKYTACVWPRLEPFLIGVLPATPPSKFSMHYLRKMACYVRTRDGCFPRLGWHMWRHIACGKLQLAEELAWLYFETFDLLMPRSAEQRLEWAEALSQCHTPKELDRQRCKVREKWCSAVRQYDYRSAVLIVFSISSFSCQWTLCSFYSSCIYSNWTESLSARHWLGKSGQVPDHDLPLPPLRETPK